MKISLNHDELSDLEALDDAALAKVAALRHEQHVRQDEADREIEKLIPNYRRLR